MSHEWAIPEIIEYVTAENADDEHVIDEYGDLCGESIVVVGHPFNSDNVILHGTPAELADFGRRLIELFDESLVVP